MTPNADLEARYVEAVRMADYIADAFGKSLALNREGQLGIATDALSRYQGWRSTLSPNGSSGTA